MSVNVEDFNQVFKCIYKHEHYSVYDNKEVFCYPLSVK